MFTTKDIEKINKYIEILDAKELAHLLQIVTNGIQRVEKNKGRPLTEKEQKLIALHEISHEAFKAERTYNVAKDWVINDRIIKEMEED